MGVGADLHVGAVLPLVAERVHVAHDRDGDLALEAAQLRARADARSSGGPRASAGCARRPSSRSAGSTRRKRSRRSRSRCRHRRCGPGRSGRPRRPSPRPRCWVRRSARPSSIARSRMIVPARSESTTPTDGVQNAPTIWSVSMNGTFSLTCSGVTSSASIPHALALDIRRRSSSIRSSVRATSKPPGWSEDAHLLVLLHRVERQVGDLPGVVHGEDEVGGVAGRPARVGQRPLVDLHDVAPAEPGEVVDEAVADDAGADDDDACGGGDSGHEALRSLTQ